MKDDNKTNDWFVRSQAALIGDGNTVWVVLMILSYGGFVGLNRFGFGSRSGHLGYWSFSIALSTDL